MKVPLKMKSLLLISFGILISCSQMLWAQDISQSNINQNAESGDHMPHNLPKLQIDLPKLQIDMKTLGGRQFWGDVCYFQGYRIQQNVITQHYRLLDPEDVRKAWGTLNECQQALAKIADQMQLKPMNGKAVILIHGIIRSSKSFSKMADALKTEGYLVVGFDYPSTRLTMTSSAEYLEKTMASLEGIEEIDLVCHSMGGLLARTYLQNVGSGRDPRIHRMVMLGTPNHGAEMANLLKKNVAFQWTLGPAGQQLAQDPQGHIANLPTPSFEFGIIAGARGTESGWNPLIPGDDDGTVSLKSAQLSGAMDFMTVHSLHSFIIEDPEGIAAVVRFLQTGCFRESGSTVPIP